MAPRARIADTIGVNGWVFIEEYEPDAESFRAFEGLGIVDRVEGLNPIQKLVPKNREEAPPNTYSGNFGTAEFPLHTDLAHWAVPPRYLALRCQRGSPRIVTRICDSRGVTHSIGTERLRMALVQPRRPMRDQRQLLRLLDRTDDDLLFRLRWDEIYLKPATSIAIEVFHRIRSSLSTTAPQEIRLVRRGDTLIIDNWRCLHGRSSATNDSTPREIDRAYLSSLI